MFLEFTILLVDDDEDDRQIFQEALHILKLPVQLQLANDGTQALALLRTAGFARPDIMFFDLNMPRMNGLELLREARKEPAYSDIPIVMYSTSSRPEDINACLKSGADTYLSKHGSFTQLCNDLLALLRKFLAIGQNGGPL